MPIKTIAELEEAIQFRKRLRSAQDAIQEKQKQVAQAQLAYQTVLEECQHWITTTYFEESILTPSNPTSFKNSPCLGRRTDRTEETRCDICGKVLNHRTITPL